MTLKQVLHIQYMYVCKTPYYSRTLLSRKEKEVIFGARP